MKKSITQYNKKMVEKINNKQWKCVCCEITYSQQTSKLEHQKSYKHIHAHFQYKKTHKDPKDEIDRIAWEQRQKDRMEYLKNNNLI